MATQTQGQENTAQGVDTDGDTVEWRRERRASEERPARGAVMEVVRTGQAGVLSMFRSQTDLALRDGRVLVNTVFDLVEALFGAQRRLVDDVLGAQWTVTSRAVEIIDPHPAGTTTAR